MVCYWYRHISNEEAATAFFEEERWGGSRTCPNPDCGPSDTDPFPSTDTPYRCRSCGKLFSVRTGTIRDDGRPLWKWLLELGFELAKEEGLSEEQAATKLFEEYRWRGSPQCPYCGSLDVQVVKNGEPMPYRCRKCRKPRKHFSVRTGTVLAKSHVPLRKLLWAIRHYYGNEKEITAAKLANKIDVAEDTARRLLDVFSGVLPQQRDQPGDSP